MPLSKLIVLLDACVLYPAPLRDTLMSLAVGDLFHARWTDAIHEEWISSLLMNWTLAIFCERIW